jgi:hypothetical protein
MATEKQRREGPELTAELLDDICEYDPFAKLYIMDLVRAWRIWDDVQDQDYPASREDLLEAFELLFMKIPTNPFFQRHREKLLTQHAIIFNTWKAANKAESGDETDQMYAHVWKEQMNELLPIVALILKGYGKMNQISDEIRGLFKSKFGE